MTDLISREAAIAVLDGLREQCAFLGSGEILTEAVDALTNMPSAESGWRPIETAPDDATVLIYEDGSVSTAQKSDGKWDYHSGKCYNPLGDYFGDYLEPSHWMPLPEFPA